MGRGRFCDVVPVRRGEEADGNRDAGVKVQIDDLLCARERLLECLSSGRKEDKKGSLASSGGKKVRKKRLNAS